MMATQKQIENATTDLTKATDAWSRVSKEKAEAERDKSAAEAKIAGISPQVDQKLAEMQAKRLVLKALLNEDLNT